MQHQKYQSDSEVPKYLESSCDCNVRIMKGEKFNHLAPNSILTDSSSVFDEFGIGQFKDCEGNIHEIFCHRIRGCAFIFTYRIFIHSCCEEARDGWTLVDFKIDNTCIPQIREYWKEHQAIRTKVANGLSLSLVPERYKTSQMCRFAAKTSPNFDIQDVPECLKKEISQIFKEFRT